MNKNYIKYFKYLLLSILLTIGGCILGDTINCQPPKILVFSDLILILIFMFSKGMLKKIMFYIFCISQGFLLSPILNNYSSNVLLISLLILFFIIVVFGIIGCIAKDLSWLGSILSVSLVSIIIYGIVKIFIPLPSLSLISILIFSIYISYDVNTFKLSSNRRVLENDEILEHVMNIYLDILNILLKLLELLSDNDD